MSQIARLVFLTVLAVALVPAAAARAEWRGGLFGALQGQPFAPDEPYAVEVAPGTYEIHRPGAAGSGGSGQDETIIVRDRPVVTTTRRVVDDPPRVIIRRHYTESWRPHYRHHRFRSWRKLHRRSAAHVLHGKRERPPSKPVKRNIETEVGTKSGSGAYPCVMKADASVTILSRDRMNISLTRKSGCEAPSSAPEKK